MRRSFTLVTEFILLGLSSIQELQILFFVLFFTIYMVTVAINLGIIVLIGVNACLHAPMYFFLSHLSFMDLCFSSIVTPKMLGIFLSERKTISYTACMVQCYFFLAFLHVEICILAVMVFDQYMAICNPLLYGSRISKYVYVCTSLITVPYVYGALTGLMETLWTYNLAFSGRNEINHFYCADPLLIRLVCSDTYKKELSMFVVAGFNFTCSLFIILISYIYIFPAMLRIRSTEGKHKASLPGAPIWQLSVSSIQLFSSCILDPLQKSLQQGKMVAVLYTTVIPCWILSSTTWGTRMWKKLWSKNRSAGNCFLLIDKFNATVLKNFYFL